MLSLAIETSPEFTFMQGDASGRTAPFSVTSLFYYKTYFTGYRI